MKNVPQDTDAVKFTVLWVDPVTIAFYGHISADNPKRQQYIDESSTHADALGFRVGRSSGWPYPTWIYETRGAVNPPDFNYPGNDLNFGRDAERRSYYGWGGTTPGSDPKDFGPAEFPPGNDPGYDKWQGSAPGAIYDLDFPGAEIRDPAPEGKIYRKRCNWETCAMIHVPESTNWIRASLVVKFFVRFSVQNEGNEWSLLYDIDGDNMATLGQTPLTWYIDGGIMYPP